MTTLFPNLSRRLVALLAAAALALLGLAVSVPGAAAEDATGGWIRLTHLSPDTPAVDVTLTSLSSKKAMLKLRDVTYGTVSTYRRVPAGTYVAAMILSDDQSSTPRINQSVTVKDGYAYTVAAVGKQANLTGKVISDDLTPPAKGTAKVRLLQASNVAPNVDVSAVQGPVLAKNATFGSATGYAEIDPGVWTVKIDPTTGDAKGVTTKVTATPGSINTVVVLDGKNGAVTARQIKDASGTAAMPKKSTGVETGGGGTATEIISTPTVGGTTWAGLAAFVLVAGLLTTRVATRRRVEARG